MGETGERKAGEGRKRPEDDRTGREPGELVGKPEDPGTPDHHEYPPGKARVLDDGEELASQSDDEPALE